MNSSLVVSRRLVLLAFFVFNFDDLIAYGLVRSCQQKVIELDTREAQRLGLLRPLVRREIEKHFNDFGLEAEFVSHNTMRGLSGGQKVKIVLGAATWRRPHVICLDEPDQLPRQRVPRCAH